MGVSLMIFVSITFLSFYQNGFMLDVIVMGWIDQLSTPFLLQIMKMITLIGSSEFILIVTLGLTSVLLYKKDWFNSLFLLSLTFGGIILNLLLKILFQRERPGEMSYIEVFSYSFEIPSYSFPSGHTMRSVLLFSFLLYLSYLFLKRASLKYLSYVICSMLMFAVASSRIFLEAHFLSDILAAISISIVWFWLCLYLFLNATRNSTAKIS